MRNLQNIIIKPIVSEKSYMEAKKFNKYTFKVMNFATKTDIRNAVEALFGVNVEHVYTNNVKGSKAKSTRTRRFTVDESYKKARVLLAKGQSIAIFEEETKEEKKKNKKEKTKE